MKRVRADAKEFSKLLNQNQGVIHKISAVYSEDSADKEDLFQEICLQLWKSYSSFKSNSHFSTWMYKVSLNTAISYTRRRSKWKRAESSYSETQLAAATDPSGEKSRLLTQAISQLNRIDRAMILLWLEGESYDEIAEIMGITKSNVSVRLVRIKREMGNIINGSGRPS
jgi:RNA polymerase sigma-70 factor (ECF subfamily)